MKNTFHQWLLTRRLRTLKREIDYVYQVRRETVRRESALKARADALSVALLNLKIGSRA